MSSPAIHYDSNLAASIPITKEQIRGGYDPALLETEKPPTPSRHNSQPTTNATHHDVESGAPLNTDPSSPSKPTLPWYRTKKGVIIIVLAVIVVLAAAIGGGVGGSRKKKNPDVQSAPVSGGPDASGGAGGVGVGSTTGTGTLAGTGAVDPNQPVGTDAATGGPTGSVTAPPAGGPTAAPGNPGGNTGGPTTGNTAGTGGGAGSGTGDGSPGGGQNDVGQPPVTLPFQPGPPDQVPPASGPGT